VRRGIWNDEGREAFRDKMNRIELEEEGVRIEGVKMERRIKKAIEEVEKEVGGEREERRGWWDECRSKKKEVRRELRRWRKRGGRGGLQKNKEGV